MYLLPGLGHREKGAGHGRRSVRRLVWVFRGGPQDLLLVPAPCDNKEEQRGTRVLRRDGLPPVVGAPGPGEGGGRESMSPAARHVVGWLKVWAPGWLPADSAAHGSVQAGQPRPVIHRLVGQGRRVALPSLPTNIVMSPVSRSSSGACRRWTARPVWTPPPCVLGPCLVQVQGLARRMARPRGVQEGRGAAAKGSSRSLARQTQRICHQKGPARLVGRAPHHPEPMEGGLGFCKPRAHSVHGILHCWEQLECPSGPGRLEGQLCGENSSRCPPGLARRRHAPRAPSPLRSPTGLARRPLAPRGGPVHALARFPDNRAW